MVQGIEVIGLENLREAVQYIKGEKAIAPEPCRSKEFFKAHADYGIDFNEVKGPAGGPNAPWRSRRRAGTTSS